MGEVLSQVSYAYAAWNHSKPLSNTDFINASSGAGGRIGYRHRIGESRFTVGADFNWATYDQYAPPVTFQLEDGGALNTDYFKYAYNYGLVASGQYTFPIGDSQIFLPYAGLGLGANFNIYKLYYNVFEESEEAGGFLVRPEAGMLIRFGERRSLGAIMGVSYDYSTNKSENYGYSNFSAFAFQLGIVITSRY